MYPWCLFVFVILLQAEEDKGSPTWPDGNYTLLKPRTGCPDGWHDKGYFYQDTIDKNPSNNRSETLHIDGEVACSHVKRYFCSKTDTASTLWPSGQYCVYRPTATTMHGMESGSIRIYDEYFRNSDSHQSTNSLVVIQKRKRNNSKRKHYDYTRLYFQCQTSGNKKSPISLPITKPFYLLPYGSRECQQVEWMVATSEWIKYHTRNYFTRSGKYVDGTVPYHELGNTKNKGVIMYYCYYQSCNYTLTEKKGVFQSPGFPGKYPDGQLCSWRIMVPDNHTLHVRFTHFSLRANDTLRYSKRIHNSLKPWFMIPISMLPPFTLSSDSDVLLVFRSDESNNSTGFRAEYRICIRQAPVTTSSNTSATLCPVYHLSSTKGMSTATPTPQPPHQNNKSSAESIKDSPFKSGNKATVVIVTPIVCLLIGVVLLTMIIYQCRRRKRCAKNLKRNTEAAGGLVINRTYNQYERDAILLSPQNGTATSNMSLNGGDGSYGTPEYEDVDCEKSNKANPNRSEENSEAKKPGSVNNSDHDPLYHVSELHDPKRQSQIEPSRESDAFNDSGPNPLYHVLEAPDPNNDLSEDQFDPKSRESEDVKESGPNPLYYFLEGPDNNNGPNKDQFNSRSRQADIFKDSGSSPLYHVLERPDPDSAAALVEDQTYEDVD